MGDKRSYGIAYFKVYGKYKTLAIAIGTEMQKTN